MYRKAKKKRLQDSVVKIMRKHDRNLDEKMALLLVGWEKCTFRRPFSIS